MVHRCVCLAALQGYDAAATTEHASPLAPRRAQLRVFCRPTLLASVLLAVTGANVPLTKARALAVLRIIPAVVDLEGAEVPPRGARRPHLADDDVPAGSTSRRTSFYASHDVARVLVVVGLALA